MRGKTCAGEKILRGEIALYSHMIPVGYGNTPLSVGKIRKTP